ncbi:two-component system copper resistance phosphate regulon response regulator CusR [Haloferula luteola]|uniref:Two-component system copper resistance phosphate regulon response regulator CusR n=1 Tax=Haloferula luteola TaxID=595692 RepID=A0A840V3M6_9BACT|nr:response regulator transcription factor [Haloferula luteola]MBB5352123.1 two-component system copper resistance phosphate regulon response regulator CusR [Haloferula luteola]
MKLLIVEDAPRLRETLEKALTRMGHAVDVAADGLEGESMARFTSYDAVVLDRMLPGKDGLSVLRDWRRDQIKVPVLLLTALDDLEDKVQGLRHGADDYLTKPFALEELVARLEALVRRRYDQPDPVLEVGPLVFDTGSRTVKRDGVPLSLTARELSLLELLVRRPGQIFSREQIEHHLYGEMSGPLSNAVDAAIYSLRKKLSPPGTPPLIHTRRGLGYVLE